MGKSNSSASTSLNTFSPERERTRFNHLQTTKSRKPNIARLRAKMQPKPDRGTMFLRVQGRKKRVQSNSTRQHTLGESYSPNPVAQKNVLLGEEVSEKIWLNDTHCTNYGTNLKGYQPFTDGNRPHKPIKTNKKICFHTGAEVPMDHPVLFRESLRGRGAPKLPKEPPLPQPPPERNTLQKTKCNLKSSRPRNGIFDLNFVTLKSFVPALSRLDLSDCTCT